MSHKSRIFNIFLSTCIALCILLWGISIYKKPHISDVIERVDQEPVRSAVSEVKSDIPDVADNGINIVTEEKNNTEKMIDKLIECLNDPDFNISQGAADEIAKMGDLAVEGLLNKLRASTDVGIRGEIVFLLGRIGSKDAVVDLSGILGDDNAYIRRNAVEALGKIKDETASGDLERSLADEDISVRERAAWSLGEITTSGSATSMITRLGEEKEDRVKSALVDSIGKIRDQTATLVLVNELKAQNDQLYKNKVVFSLGEIKDPAAVNDLKDYVNKLKKYNPTEPIVIFQWKEAIRIAEEAINKIQTTN
jgi:HEAT repeat protein